MVAQHDAVSHHVGMQFVLISLQFTYLEELSVGPVCICQLLHCLYQMGAEDAFSCTFNSTLS